MSRPPRTLRQVRMHFFLVAIVAVVMAMNLAVALGESSRVRSVVCCVALVSCVVMFGLDARSMKAARLARRE
ncbi:hypothetical protein [Flexivirga alba]|uniref:Uncharacterized protein n=1 Tax=Flexivirga alba TaxID=702742 RepID=A0ABW2AIQ0_9MICO